VGDESFDTVGENGVEVLPNGNFVVSSSSEIMNGIEEAGSVSLWDGSTGEPVGYVLVGDEPDDQIGFGRVVGLSNGNFVVTASRDDIDGVVDAGSVTLIDGVTGVLIGQLTGNSTRDRLGNLGAVELSNGNFVVVSPSDNEDGVARAGSVRLVNGVTGTQIGSALAGDVEFDFLGGGGVTALPNGHYVIASPSDDEGGIVDAGSVRLVDGFTGTQIGSAYAGDADNDRVGLRVRDLPNGNYLVASRVDNEGGISNAGSVRLFNGDTATAIGSVLVGDVHGDQLGSFTDVLSNGNYVVASPLDDEDGIVDAGSVRLLDGITGVQIGDAIVGESQDNSLGSRGIVVLANDNVVIASPGDDVGGIVDAGSVRLLDGEAGVQIGGPLAGDDAGDQIGSSGAWDLSNGDFVVVSPLDDESGSIRLVDGTTAEQIGDAIVGGATGDMFGATAQSSPNGDYHIVAMPGMDHNGMVDSGMVQLIEY
jgi:WD40 repeat protein